MLTAGFKPWRALSASRRSQLHSCAHCPPFQQWAWVPSHIQQVLIFCIKVNYVGQEQLQVLMKCMCHLLQFIVKIKCLSSDLFYAILHTIDYHAVKKSTLLNFENKLLSSCHQGTSRLRIFAHLNAMLTAITRGQCKWSQIFEDS